MATFFESAGYVMENAWEATGEPQKLTKAEQNNILRAIIKDKVLEDGTTIKNVIFMMKSGKPRSFKLSPYNEQYKNGTRMDVSSIEITEYSNSDGELKYTVTGDAE
jgi:hypoxanthine-guanine phosphoribosyltransferase